MTDAARIAGLLVMIQGLAKGYDLLLETTDRQQRAIVTLEARVARLEDEVAPRKPLASFTAQVVEFRNPRTGDAA